MQSKPVVLALACLVLSVPLLAQNSDRTYPPLPLPRSDAEFGLHIQRTMTLLGRSTPDQRNRVRIMFYGQSITKQKWADQVAEDIRRAFPSADLEIVNRAIGGFDSKLLVRTLPQDVIDYYPDLVVFHDYGPEPEYETMVAEMRRRTGAEVLLMSDHIATGQSYPEKAAWHDKHSSVWLPQIAKKYGCEFVDIREPWRQYLKERSIKPEALLTDQVHLNGWGNWVMAQLVERHLRYRPALDTDEWRESLQYYRLGKEAQWKNGKLTLEFTGNRIEALPSFEASGKSGKATVKIDGKSPSELPECYAISRANDLPGKDWPWQVGAPIRIAHEKPLLLEDWTAKIKQVDPDGKLHFEVSGSKTGTDGSGTSSEKFVSKSGRVVIEPGDWWTRNVKGEPLFKAGSEVTWHVVPLFSDIYEPVNVTKSDGKEHGVLLAQGLSNGPHTVELTVQGKSRPAFFAFKVNRPLTK